MTRLLQVALTIAGVLLVTAGAALIYPPAGLIVLGIECSALGLFVIDDGTSS